MFKGILIVAVVVVPRNKEFTLNSADLLILFALFSLSQVYSMVECEFLLKAVIVNKGQVHVLHYLLILACTLNFNRNMNDDT